MPAQWRLPTRILLIQGVTLLDFLLTNFVSQLLAELARHWAAGDDRRGLLYQGLWKEERPGSGRSGPVWSSS